MTAADCIADIKRALGREISDDELERALTTLQRRRKVKRAESVLADTEATLLKDAEEIAAEALTDATIAKRNAALSLIRRNERDGFYDRFESPALGIEAINVGVNNPTRGARLSVDARGKGLEGEWHGGIIHDLRGGGHLEILNKGVLDRETARELFELDKDGGKPGVSGSKEARTIAAAIHKYQEAARLRLNRAGAFIAKQAGYIVRQSHDMFKIRKAGYQAWRDHILPRLDERTFADVEDREDFLRGVFNALSSGVHLKAGADGIEVIAGSGNLAKKVSQERVLHFKDADSWFDYNERFGIGSLSEAVFGGLRRAAQNVALLEVWGPNPRAAFEADLKRLEAKHRGDPEALEALRDERLVNQFDEIDGFVNIPGNPTLARIGASLRAAEVFSKLGGALLSSFNDISTKTAALRRNGINLLEGYGNALGSILEGRTTGERRQIADLIGTGIEGMHGATLSRFSADDGLPGAVSKLQRGFFKLNGLSWWTDAHKTGVGLILARNLDQQRGLKWGDLNEDLRRILGTYDFDERAWDLIRTVEGKAADGQTYLTPDSLRQLDEGTIRAFLGKPKATALAVERARDDLVLKLQSYYIDQADFAVITPGARERAILNQGKRRGTPVGEALRFLGQFKAFPTAVITKGLGPELYGRGARNLREALLQGKGDYLGLAHLIVSSTVLGYLAGAAKDVAKGRMPRDPRDPKTWAAALVQGGGLGIYGDFLFGETNRYGGGAISTVAGPVLGSAEDLVDLYQRARDGKDFGAQLFRFGINNAPGANLFYTRVALDYLILYDIQERINPGFLKRMEQRLKKEQGQTFYFPPSRHTARLVR